ncbi:hypothetical protein N9Y37_05630 [Luminiphilus sp.]|mgnify:FL=1|jgi:hypothetical protein|nr:hypothetical protein [Luminiphilus sp.]
MKKNNFAFLILFALVMAMFAAVATSQSNISLNEAALFPEDI